MRYFIAYLIPGDAARFHTQLSDVFADRFHVRKVSEDVAPHFTLKAPFETDDVSVVKSILTEFAEKEHCEQVTLSNIGTFNEKVIYMDATAPKQTHMLIRRLQDRLRNISWLPFYPTEFPITLHATLGYAKNREQGREMLAWLRKQKIPEFHLSLDHVVLLERTPDRWVEHSRYLLQFPIS